MWGHVTQFWNFGTPLISRERLKLETSNLARRRTAESSNEKNAELGQIGVIWMSRDPMLEFWDPLISRKRMKLETSNLARRRTAVSSNEIHSKLSEKGSCGSHLKQFWNFGTPKYISRMVEARNFKFGRETDSGEF